MNVSVRFAALALLAGALHLPAAELLCASAESMDGLMEAWTSGFSAQHPDKPARLVLKSRYSSDFLDALARGQVRVAPFARELFPAERARFKSLVGSEPRMVPVATGSRAMKGGTHAIVMFVNARNPLAQLSLEQLRGVWARGGTVTTWGQLGLTGEWAARKISLHGMQMRRETGNPPGIVNFLDERMLTGHGWRDDVHEYLDIPSGAQALEQIVRAIAADDAALGYSGFAYATPGVKSVPLGETDAGPFYAGTPDEISRRDYPLTRTIYLCAGPAADAAVRDFVRYTLSTDGQRAIIADAHGFFPLTASAAAEARALLATTDLSLPPYQPRPVELTAGARYVNADGAIAIIGYNDMLEMLTALNARFVTVHPGFAFSLMLKGTRTAPGALSRGESVFAPMGAEFSPSELAAYRAATGHEPLVFRIAHCSLSPKALSGPLAIFVHKDSPLTSLTLDEVADIFSGRNTRGLHSGGLAPETALGIFMRRHTLGAGAFSADFRAFRQSADVVAWVAVDRQTIGFAAANRTLPGVKILALAPDMNMPPVAPTDESIRLGRYLLDRFLLIYARQPLQPFVREYLRFVFSREGQQAIAAGSLGYLPLNAAEAAAERAKL